MAKVLNYVCSMSRSMTKVHCRGRVVNRLCLRNTAFIRIVPSRARSCSTSRHSSSTAVLPAFSDEPECSESIEPCYSLPCDPVKLTGMKSIWMDREALHLVLEDNPLLRNNVYIVEDFQHTCTPFRKFSLLHPAGASILQASPAEIIDFVVSYCNTMGRQDFQEVCQYITARLPTFSEDEVLELMKAMYALKFEGNVTLLWDTIDRDLVRRFASHQHYRPTTKPDFFLRSVDIIYWLNILSRSAFAQKYLATLVKRELQYPIGIQLLFYASCGPLKWRGNFEMQMLYPFLNKIKRTCPFDLFLVALECSLACNISTQLTCKTSLPNGLYHFLVEKAYENVSDDKTLTIIFQLIFTHKGSNNPSPFQELIRKIVERRHSISSVVVYYVCYMMARFGTEPEQFLNLLESGLQTKYLHPQVFWKLVLSVYARFGPEVVNKLSDVISEELQRQDICTLPEGQLLRIFSVLADCGINAFPLWETTMQGDALVPNFAENSSFRPKNGLHLSADDCIEVNCPTYGGSRLSETLRKELYYEFCNLYKDSNPCPGLIPLLKKISDGNMCTTNIVPGYMTPGTKDVILCRSSKGQFCDPTNFINTEIPWSLKKISPHTPNLSFFAVWFRPQNWPECHATLKNRTLEKLGYTSVMVDIHLWDSPETCRDHCLYSKLICLEPK